MASQGQTATNYDHLRRKPRNTQSIYGNVRTPSDPQTQEATWNNTAQSRRLPGIPRSIASEARESTTSQESANTHITEPPAYSKKFVVVGDGGCGKTCLLISYAEGHFPEKYVPTVFENYITTTSHPPTGKNVELALWDTAGQEEYDRLRPLSYPETDLLFVCFAIDCPNSLENVMDKWYPEVLHFCPTTPLILCGLKSDLRTKRTCIELLKTQGLTPVTFEQGKAVADKMGATYMECSAKERIGVEEIFDRAITIAVGVEEEEKAFMRGEAPVQNSGRSSKMDSGRNSGLSGGRRKKKKGGCRLL